MADVSTVLAVAAGAAATTVPAVIAAATQVRVTRAQIKADRQRGAVPARCVVYRRAALLGRGLLI
jgi:hypothetical protein